MYDIIIKNGLLIDGVQQNGEILDLAIANGKIKKIAKKISEATHKTIEAHGLVVAPSFIDSHSHNDSSCIFHPSNFQKLEQGITSEVVGLCGESFFPVNAEDYENTSKHMNSNLDGNSVVDPKMFTSTKKWHDYISKLDLGTNMLTLVGHGAIRSCVMGFADRKATKDELEQMKSLLIEALESGAIGFSSGLAYAPGLFSDNEEITALCHILAKYNGVYATHMRNQGANLLNSVKDSIAVAKETGCTVIISHLKSIGKPNFGLVAKAVEMIEQAQAEGAKVYCDAYPYLAGSTTLRITLPPSILSGGDEDMLKRLENSETRDYIKNQILNPTESWENAIGNNGFDSILVVGAEHTPEFEGKNLSEIAQALGTDEFTAYFDLLIKNHTHVRTINFVMSKDDLRSAITSKYCMIGTDGYTSPDTNIRVHPRLIGTFPQFFADFVQGEKLISLKQALHQTSALPAYVYGLKNKGQIKEGFDADIIIFDLENLKATNSFAEAHNKNEGIKNVICNGKIVVEDNIFNGNIAGKLILREER